MINLIPQAIGSDPSWYSPLRGVLKQETKRVDMGAIQLAREQVQESKFNEHGQRALQEGVLKILHIIEFLLLYRHWGSIRGARLPFCYYDAFQDFTSVSHG